MFGPLTLSYVFYYCILLICGSAEVCLQHEHNEVRVSFSDRKKPFRDKNHSNLRKDLHIFKLSCFTIQPNGRKISNTKQTRWKRKSGHVYFARLNLNNVMEMCLC